MINVWNKYIQQVKILCEGMKRQSNIVANVGLNEMTETSGASLGTYDVMESFLKDDDWELEMNTTEQSVLASVNEEIRIYMDMKTEPVAVNVLKWWADNSAQLPTLSKAARFAFSIPASSAAPEREFSTANFVVDDRRSLLSPSNVEDTLICHGNDDLLKIVMAETEAE